MKNVGYYNGKLGPLEEMSVPMRDRAVYYGDGCYEAALCAGGAIFALSEHIDRFFNSLALLRIELDISRAELEEILLGCVAEADGVFKMLYWQVSRGTDYRRPEFPAAGVKPNLMVTVRPGGPCEWDYAMKLKTVPDTRYLHCNIKTLNLLPNVLACQSAAESGCDEAVFVRDGRVTEGARSNVHIIKDGVFITHPTGSLILAGTARAQLIGLCGESGIPVREEPFTPEEMSSADEVIVSSTGAFCLRAGETDGVAVGGRAPELVETLQKALKKKFLAETGVAI